MKFKKAFSRAVSYFVLIGFIVMGAIGLYLIAGDVYYGVQSPDWPVTTGKVISSSVDSRHRSKGRRRHRLNIEYQYTVDSVAYTQTKAEFLGTLFATKNHKLGIVQRFPTGSSTDVYYHPDAPHIAVLIPGVSPWSATAGAVICLLLCGVGLGGLHKLIR